MRLIIIDSNGLPANRQIIDAVYLHIMGTGDEDVKRLADEPSRIASRMRITYSSSGSASAPPVMGSGFVQ